MNIDQGVQARRMWIGAVVGIAVGVLLVLLLYTLISTRLVVGEVRKGQEERVGTFNLLVSCTNGTGKCSRDAQRGTKSAINELVLSQVAAVACADQPGTQSPQEIRACVRRSLAKMGK